jgi:PAS domain S-box-containing protein
MYIADDKSKLNTEGTPVLNITSLFNLFYSANISTWSLEFPTAILKISKEKKEALGYPINKLNHYVEFTDLLHPDDYESTVKSLTDHIEKNKNVFDSTYRLRKFDGTYLWFRDIGMMIPSVNSKNKLIQGISYDITSTMESIQKYKKIIDHTDTIVWEYNLKNGNVSIYNESSWKELIGNLFNKSNNLTINEFLDLFHEKDKQIIESEIFKLIGGIKNNSILEARIFDDKSEPIWVKFKSKIISDTNHNFEKITGTITNINELKRIEFERQKLLSAVEQSNSIFVITDTNGIVEYANPKFYESTGYSSEEILNKKISVINSGLMSKEFYNDLWTTIKSGNTWRGEFINKKKNGELFYEKAVISAIKNENDEIVRYFQVSEDITELKNTQQIAVSNEKVKSEFLAQISHEIRTPVNVLLTFSSLIEMELGDKINDEIFDQFRIMRRAGKRLIRTVDLILNMSEIQAGAYKPQFKFLNIESQILEPLADEYKLLAKEKGIAFVYKKLSQQSKLFIDEYTVTQIFINLFDNAFKYTPSGKISINCRVENSNFIVDVEDTGIGISEEFKENIFKPFSQEHTGYTRRFEGNGLGLALVKEYCSINNAKIYLESKLGSGTKFSVIFKC